MFLLYSLTAATLAVCALGFFLALTAWMNPSASADNSARTARFMALGGMLLSVGFALVIVATAIPKMMLSPCD
jgi:hypothetical protein